jgi:putative ATP-binding cassette transporter
VLRNSTKLFLLPQRAYVPLGSLCRAATYPLDPESVKAEDVRDALESVGLGHFKDRIDEEGPWEQTLSGGEKQRLAFARLLIHKPDLIVMDEATSALDPASQDQLMQLVVEKIPSATIISVGHRPELEAYHERKLVLEHRPGGARIIDDEYLTVTAGRGVALLRRIFRRRRADSDTATEPAPAAKTVEQVIAVPADKTIAPHAAARAKAIETEKT